MIAVNIYGPKEGVAPYWLGYEAPITLQATPEGVVLSFDSEMGREKIELCFHPSMVRMLMDWIEAQPKHTFMAKEGKAEMIAEMEAFDAEWAEKSRLQASSKDGIEYPF